MLFRKRPASFPNPAARRAPKPILTESAEHRVGERTLPLTLRRNPRATRLTLRIERGGQGLALTIPPDTPKRAVDGFLARQTAWLEARLALLPDRPRLRAGAKLPVRGVPHRLVYAGGRGGVSVAQDETGPVLLVHGEEASLPRRVADFLKAEARRELTPLVARHTQTVGRAATAVRLRDTSSRWGSCTSAGALSFSWRILMAPPPVIDYLVAHEVAHLKEMNHGPRFWALCEKLCPATPRCRLWLKRNGAALQAISFD